VNGEDRVLARAVWVDGVKWAAGSTPPPHIAAKITNPRAWTTPDAVALQADQPARATGASDGTRLARAVWVEGRKYLPGDVVPDEVASKITNPKAWEGGRLPNLDGGQHRSPRDVVDSTPVQQVGVAAGGPDRDGDNGDGVDGDPRVPPPRAGKGSGIGPWRTFAEAHNVACPPDASRDDIIAACEAAGVITAE
jgi:hypothetical protein